MAKDFKTGDIVTCPRSGWWKVQSIDPRRNDRVILELVLSRDGKMPKKTPRTYTAYTHWCQKLSVDEVLKNKDQSIRIWDTLLMIIDPKQVINNKEVIAAMEQHMEKPEPEYLTRIGPPPSLSRK